MSDYLDQDRWTKIKDDSRRWWAGDLGRPLIQVRLKDPTLSPGHEFASFYPMTAPVEQILDHWDAALEATVFLGDAFPHVCPNFGPGVIAAFAGAQLVNGNDTVWFHPAEAIDMSCHRFVYEQENAWLKRCRDLVRAAMERWEGRVQCAFTDLGGNLDILSTFRPAEQLIYDLYDCPDQVKRLTWSAHDLWWRCFEEFESLMHRSNPGYSSWAAIFSEAPHYMLQCDFCYMIGPDMFAEFVQPELEATAKRLAHAFYHLDGQGQLVHLDSLLAMESIQGIQWVPGAGAPDVAHWPEVYEKITAAGKKIHIVSNMCEQPFEILDILKQQIGCLDHVVYCVDADVSQRKEAEAMLKRFGAL